MILRYWLPIFYAVLITIPLQELLIAEVNNYNCIFKTLFFTIPFLAYEQFLCDRMKLFWKVLSLSPFTGPMISKLLLILMNVICLLGIMAFIVVPLGIKSNGMSTTKSRHAFKSNVV